MEKVYIQYHYYFLKRSFCPRCANAVLSKDILKTVSKNKKLRNRHQKTKKIF